MITTSRVMMILISQVPQLQKQVGNLTRYWPAAAWSSGFSQLPNWVDRSLVLPRKETTFNFLIFSPSAFRLFNFSPDKSPTKTFESKLLNFFFNDGDNLCPRILQSSPIKVSLKKSFTFCGISCERSNPNSGIFNLKTEPLDNEGRAKQGQTTFLDLYGNRIWTTPTTDKGHWSWRADRYIFKR